MTRSDLRQVRRIERAAYTDAWPQTTFERELRNGFAEYFVAVELPPDDGDDGRPPRGALAPLRWLVGLGGVRDRVVGFGGVWFTVDQLHLVTIAVDPELQGRGIARRMLLHCFSLAREAEMRSVVLEVRASNDRAIELYEQFGFQRAGRLDRYYADNGEDALVMLTPALDDRGFRQHVEQLRIEHRRRYGDSFVATGPPAAVVAPAGDAAR